MTTTLRRLRCEQSGGAMAEYGIALALVSGAQWLEQKTRIIGNDPVTLISAGLVVALVLGYLLKPAR